MERAIHAPKNPVLLTVALSGFVLLAAMVNLFPPDSLVVIGIFVVGFSFSTALLTHYIFRRFRHTAVAGVTVAILLLMRAFGLRNPLFLVLLAAVVISVEVALQRR